MKVELESTDALTDHLGVATRVWQGRTERGISVYAFIAEIAVLAAADQEVFQRELLEKPPKPLAIPLRMLL